MSVIGHWSKIGEKAPQTLSYQWIQPTEKSIDKIPIVCYSMERGDENGRNSKEIELFDEV